MIKSYFFLFLKVFSIVLRNDIIDSIIKRVEYGGWMLIYIIHSDKYYSFSLPNEIAGNYVIEDYDENGFSRNLINVIAQDDKWIMNANENVRIIFDNKAIDSCEVMPFNWYFLANSLGEKILLYTVPNYDNHYIVKSIKNDGNIIIGKDSQCDLVASYSMISPKQLSLSHNDSKWFIKNLNPEIPLFVNSVKVEECTLNSFDVIFIAGLKFVLCGNLIFFYCPLRNIMFRSSLFEDAVQMLAASDNNYDFQNYVDFYNSDDYFSKSPVFFKKINDVDLELQAPEEKETFEYQSIIMTMIPTALMSITTLVSTYYTIKSFKSGESDYETYISTIVLVVIMFILCFVWPFVERFSEKLRLKLHEKRRVKYYRKYLEKKKSLLEKITKEQKAVLFFNNLSLEECQNVILERTANLFSLNPEQEQFLQVRLGTGKVLLNCKMGYTKPDFVKEEDVLEKELENLVDSYRYIDQAPFTISLKENIALINSNRDFNKYLEAIILQIVALHDYHDVKIVVLTHQKSKLDSIRLINHCWNDDRTFRYFATNMQDAEYLSSELMKIYTKRLSLSGTAEKIPHYLIITDDINQYRNLKIIDEIAHQQENNGFSFLVFASRLTEVPSGCSHFCVYTDDRATLFKSDMDEKDQVSFSPEFVTNQIDFSKCINILANIPIKSNYENSSEVSLPEKLGFLEMYKVGKVEQLNSANRWKNSQIVNTLAAPIGVDTTGNILSLDLHEKKHGPHGLIAGMTGSGKSETIITYLLSLAVNYSPDEVQFVLIDYKGGGLAGAFENRRTGVKLPHLVGTITNLDTSEMNRTLVSIKSELKRRQQIFNRAKEELNTGTIDIYKYQGYVRDGLIKEPLSHLFIVCDEFAELKQQQPEFMEEIVSAARIGRSLGIHLILATQKPSGVVDDQIWSNSRFKLCCKVQTAEDSSEMLRKPDAAYLTEAGRFYLQIGYDEYYILAQSAYSGVEYFPSDRVFSKIDNTISFVNSLGEVYKNVSPKKVNNQTNHERYGEELINVIKYLIDVAKKENYTYHQLWLDNVPDILYYNSLVSKYHPITSPYDINPIIGEYDDPTNQSQGLVSLPITTGGNVYIAGNTGSGKNTLLSTIISSTIVNHNSDEVNIYIIDMGAEKLKKFSDAPQVGDVLTVSNGDELKYLMFMLQVEMVKRQRFYADNGGDFLRNVKDKNCPFPNILVFLYDLDSFKERYEYFFEENVIPLTRTCAKYGIYFIVTGNTYNSLGYAAEQNFNHKVMLNLSDPSDYSNAFNNYPVIKKNPGRGIISVNENAFEFQTCLFFEEDKEQDYLATVIKQLNDHLKTRAKPVPSIPERVTFDIIKNDISTLDCVPLGINMLTAQIDTFDFNSLVTVISSEKIISFTRFLSNMQKIMLKIPKTKIIILNALEDIKISYDESVIFFDSGFSKVVESLKNNILKCKNNPVDENYMIFVLNYSGLNGRLKQKKKELKDDNYSTMSDLILMAQDLTNFHFVLYDVSSESEGLHDGELIDFFDGSRGLWIGSGFDGQMIFDVSNSSDINSLNDEFTIKVEARVGFEVKTIR